VKTASSVTLGKFVTLGKALYVFAAAATFLGPLTSLAGDPPTSVAPAERAVAAPAPVRHYALDAISVQGCTALPYPPNRRELWVRESRAVDPTARFWMLDRPVAYEAHVASVDYRLGSGRLHVTSELSEDLTEERISLSVEQPISAEYLQAFLPGVELPCSRRIRYSVHANPSEPEVDLSAAVRFDDALHDATELLYDARFEASRARLQDAIELRPDDPSPYWMMARLRYLELESAAADRETRIAGYADAEHWANLAVERAPLQPEGYLWQAVARGRRITSQPSMSIALQSLASGRGPRWLRETLERAVALAETYRFFGNSTRADALYALAQFDRLAPTAWYMSALGAPGDIDRSVALLRETVALQPSRIEYHKELAVSLLCRGAIADRPEAEQELRRALQLPTISVIDTIDQAHARALLARVPAEVCAYSRDSYVPEEP
jgi:hypothetical protein